VFRYDRLRDVEVTVKKTRRLLSRGVVLSQGTFYLVYSVPIRKIEHRCITKCTFSASKQKRSPEYILINSVDESNGFELRIGQR